MSAGPTDLEIELLIDDDGPPLPVDEAPERARSSTPWWAWLSVAVAIVATLALIGTATRGERREALNELSIEPSGFGVFDHDELDLETLGGIEEWPALRRAWQSDLAVLDNDAIVITGLNTGRSSSIDLSASLANSDGEVGVAMIAGRDEFLVSTNQQRVLRVELDGTVDQAYAPDTGPQANRPPAPVVLLRGSTGFIRTFEITDSGPRFALIDLNTGKQVTTGDDGGQLISVGSDLLVERAGRIFQVGSGGQLEPFAQGSVLEVGPEKIVWWECDETDCQAWMGTIDNPRAQALPTDRAIELTERIATFFAPIGFFEFGGEPLAIDPSGRVAVEFGGSTVGVPAVAPRRPGV